MVKREGELKELDFRVAKHTDSILRISDTEEKVRDERTKLTLESDVRYLYTLVGMSKI